jgi:RNA polymerase sigma-70 factor (ECF subfamily)
MLEENAFRALYAEHTPALHLLAMRLTGNRSDADDAVQETWIRVARKPESLRAAASPRAWLCAIVINCCREQRRSRLREIEAPEPVDSAPGVRIDLETAVRALPDGFREVLVLHDVEGHTHEEIAQLLGIEASTSRSQLARARERLRRNLEGYRD